MDDQVKIRGYRIELGEIESVLSRHEQVREAAVTVREDSHGDKRLIGYVTTRGEVGVSAMELRGWLKQHLPEYMIPAQMVVLEALPLTTSGKVDRKALPEPERQERNSQPLQMPHSFERSFHSPVRTLLADIWAEVLGREWVGLHDNFFELGGHSLKQVSILSRVQMFLGCDVPLRVMFERPTVAGMAGYIEEALRSGVGVKVRRR